MEMKLTEIIGLDESQAKKLNKEGISSVEDLLTLSKYQIKKLAEKTGIPAKDLDTWQEHADLMRVKGIDPEYANALNIIGVDSVKELAQRNPKKTHERFVKLDKEQPKLIKKVPTLNVVKGWISEAKKLGDTPSKPVKPSKPKKPSKPNVVVDPGEHGEYGPEYWNNKWEKAPIIYTGRALRGESYDKQIDVDVKTFIKKNDAILQHVIKQVDLKKSTPNETAWACQKFVNDFLTYKFDEESSDCVEFWQFPFESIQSSIGDCEDGAIITAALMINACIPAWRVKVCAGNVLADPVTAPSDSELGGHGWALFLADREDSERKLEWVILDWCYLQDPETPIEDKPLARDGGHNNAYKEVWFTFNDEYSWAQTAFEVSSARISDKRKTKKEEALTEFKEFLKDAVREQVEKIMKEYNLKIE